LKFTIPFKTEASAYGYRTLDTEEDSDMLLSLSH